MRKITKEYIGYHISPTQVFVSGMFNRIKEELESQGFDIKEVFCEGYKRKEIRYTVEKELLRSGYNSGMNNFKELVKGHVDML